MRSTRGSGRIARRTGRHRAWWSLTTCALLLAGCADDTASSATPTTTVAASGASSAVLPAASPDDAATQTSIGSLGSTTTLPASVPSTFAPGTPASSAPATSGAPPAPSTSRSPEAPTTSVPPVPPLSVPPTRGNGTFLENFDQDDGPLAGWQVGSTAQQLEVVDNRCSSNDNTDSYRGAALHGLDLSGDFEIEASVITPKISSNGGVNVWLIDAAGNGWGVFVGNAVHIQKVTAFTHRNVTNVGVPGEGTAGVRSSRIRLTRERATGRITAYLDGIEWGHITDTDRKDVGMYVVIVVQNTRSPADETSIDDLLVSSTIRS